MTAKSSLPYTLTNGTLPAGTGRPASAEPGKWATVLATVELTDGRSEVKAYTVPDGVSVKATLRHLRTGAKMHGLKVRASLDGQTINFRLTKPF